MRILALNSLQMMAGYLFIAGLFWMLGYRWFRELWRQQKIIPAYPEAADIRREIYHSIISIFIFALAVLFTVWMSERGWNRLYWNPEQYGRVWFWASIPATILLHDTYFYWTHRLMHHRWLFRWFHRTHHLSHNSTPFTAYAFAPLEAVVQAGILPLTAIVYPIHPFPFGVFMVFQFSTNVLIHAGYEMFPRAFMGSWISRVLSTPTSHVIHHEYGRGNYGFVFSFWDWWMGTSHVRYPDRFRSAAPES